MIRIANGVGKKHRTSIDFPTAPRLKIYDLGFANENGKPRLTRFFDRCMMGLSSNTKEGNMVYLWFVAFVVAMGFLVATISGIGNRLVAMKAVLEDSTINQEGKLSVLKTLVEDAKKIY